MKKLLTLTAVGAMMTAPAFAVQQCVFKPTMDNWEVCNEGTDGMSYGMNWWVKCNGVQYRGIATFSLSDVGDVADDLDSDGSIATERVYCYCKMIYPVLSKWIRPTSQLSIDLSPNVLGLTDVTTNALCAQACVDYGDEGEGYASTVLKFLNNLEEN